MKLAVNLPVVVRQPHISRPWEAGATIEDLATIVVAAETLGYHHVTCSEHVGVTTAAADAGRGTTYWDPLATFGYLAARTETIRLATNILVLGYHHPLAVAKRYGTLDRLSGGRLILGVGVGTLVEEFELLGATFDGRGEIADEAMDAIAASFGRRLPAFHGQHYGFDAFIIEPHGIQTPPPLWVGGRSRRSLRRAVEHGHGWCPFALAPKELRAMLDEVDRPEGFECVFAARPVDPVGDPDGARRGLEAMAGAGATVIPVTVLADSPAAYIEGLHTMRELARGVVDLTTPSDAAGPPGPAGQPGGGGPGTTGAPA